MAFVAAVLFLAWSLRKALAHPGEALAVLLLASGVAYKINRFLRPRRLRAKAITKAKSAVDRNMEQLLRRRDQLIQPDPYGKPQTDKWIKEAAYFEKEHIRPLLSASEISALRDGEISLCRLVQARVDARAKERPQLVEFSEDFKPTEFEHFCAKQLCLNGWDAKATGRSGDQGIDVIAEKAGIRVVLQCKLYSRPVGNHAVQEVAAGRSHQRAHYAAVVSNHGYTSAARQLAKSNTVLLLHYRDLASLDDFIRQTANQFPDS